MASKIYAARQYLTPDGRAIVALLRDEVIRLGWSETARRTGLDRCSLHRAFGPTKATKSPNFSTIVAVADAVGLEFTVRRRA